MLCEGSPLLFYTPWGPVTPMGMYRGARRLDQQTGERTGESRGATGPIAPVLDYLAQSMAPCLDNLAQSMAPGLDNLAQSMAPGLDNLAQSIAPALVLYYIPGCSARVVHYSSTHRGAR